MYWMSMLRFEDIKLSKTKCNRKGEMKVYSYYSVLSGKINTCTKYKYNLLLFIHFIRRLKERFHSQRGWHLSCILEATTLFPETFPTSSKKTCICSINQSFYAAIEFDVILLLILVPWICLCLLAISWFWQVMRQLTHYMQNTL